MAQSPESRVAIEQFAGQRSNASPHSLEPGQAVVQLNVACVADGRLDARLGMTQLVFDN